MCLSGFIQEFLTFKFYIMAIVNSIILGRAKGSAGNVTLSTQQGRVILKQKATEVRNPQTARQTVQRGKLAKAVRAWQQINQYVKSGITALVPYGFEYQTYISRNMDILAANNFDADKLTGEAYVGSYASIGRLGELPARLDEVADSQATLIVDGAALSSVAKIGDKIKILLLSSLNSNKKIGTVTVDAQMLLPGSHAISFTIPDAGSMQASLYAAWLETADGKDSTTSTITDY